MKVRSYYALALAGTDAVFGQNAMGIEESGINWVWFFGGIMFFFHVYILIGKYRNKIFQEKNRILTERFDFSAFQSSPRKC